MTQRFAILAAVVVVAFLGVVFFITRSSDTPCGTGQIAGGSVGGPFTLVDENGQTVTDTDVIDAPALIYFGYTFCPDICPLDNARNAEAVTLLEERGVMVKPVFISVDPKRDTPEVMKEFTDYLHPRMLGLTGSADQVKTAARAYRAYFKAHEPEEGQEEFYLVDHSTFTYLMTPEDGFLQFFRREVTGEEMADQVQCFLDR